MDKFDKYSKYIDNCSSAIVNIFQGVNKHEAIETYLINLIDLWRLFRDNEFDEQFYILAPRLEDVDSITFAACIVSIYTGGNEYKSHLSNISFKLSNEIECYIGDYTINPLVNIPNVTIIEIGKN